MPVHALPLLRLLLIAVLLTATGCPPSEQSTPAPTSTSPPSSTPVEPDPLPTDYRSHMAFNVELLDPATGLPMPADMQTLKPTLLREVQRATSDPILRQTLNRPAVQDTTWFKTFEGDPDEALQALRGSIVARHVPGTPLFRVYALDSLETDADDDAQVILQALGDTYLRRTHDAVNASILEQLNAAQRARDEAEDAVLNSTAQLKRHLQNNPISSSSIERTRMSALETEALQEQLRHAEVRREAALSKIIEIRQRTKGFLGYFVSQEYPPQQAR